MIARFLRSSPLLLAVVVGIVIGMVVARSDQPELRAEGGKTQQPDFTMQMRIGANLYLQTSAEYQAACLQVYRLAGERLQQVARQKPTDGRKNAVIMDLDETVFDNSAFQTYLYRSDKEYSDPRWDNYEQNYPQDVSLIPGAKEFIDNATALGVDVVFLSNRLERYRSSTASALNRLGLAGEGLDGRLFLKLDTSDKTARRAAVMAKHHVLMLLGDNLRDFSEVFVAPKLSTQPTPAEIQSAIAERKLQVDKAAEHWGRDWFIIPNPVYGEWDKLIKVNPVELMHPTTMPVQ